MPSPSRGRRNRRSKGKEEAPPVVVPAYITRQIPEYEILGEEGLVLIEANADKILEETGIDFKDDPEALAMWKEAGAAVDDQLSRRRP